MRTRIPVSQVSSGNSAPFELHQLLNAIADALLDLFQATLSWQFRFRRQPKYKM